MAERAIAVPARHYALATADPAHWDEALLHLQYGAIALWIEERGGAPRQLALLRSLVAKELEPDTALALALKVLSPDLPLLNRSVILSPGWLLEHPESGYALIAGDAPAILTELGTEPWLGELRRRADRVRERAKRYEVDLVEARLRVLLLSTSGARLRTLWDEQRRLFPDTDHRGLANLIDRPQWGDDDLILLLAAEPGQFCPIGEVVADAAALCEWANIPGFDAEAARVLVSQQGRRELFLAGAVLQTRMLEVQYRSNFRELIAFSNAAFYAGRLHVPVQHPAERVRAQRPIEVVRVDGLYQNQSNLENVQGDERDIMLFSTTFGRNVQGQFRRNFGVLGQRGGERRLNVAITRAKDKILLATSMPVAEVADLLGSARAPAQPRDYLQAYLAYAEHLSDGDLDAAASLISRFQVHSGGHGQQGKRDRRADPFIEGALKVPTSEIAAMTALREHAEVWLAGHREATAARARREAVLSGLAAVGYEVREGMAGLWSQGGRLVLRRGDSADVGVELSGKPATGRMQVRAVGLKDATNPWDHGRDIAIEQRFCEDVRQLGRRLGCFTRPRAIRGRPTSGTQRADWDAAIIAAARTLGAGTLYSEDLSQGQDYDGVRVVNPFLLSH